MESCFRPLPPCKPNFKGKGTEMKGEFLVENQECRVGQDAKDME